MIQYHELLKEVLTNGRYKKPARQNMPGTWAVFGMQSEYDLRKGFPLLTTKKTSFKTVVEELLWFLRGQTNAWELSKNGINIWNEDAYSFYAKLCARESKNPMKFYEFDDMLRNTDDPQELTDIINTTNNAYELPAYPYILGDCGQQYGLLWRDFNGDIDQIKNLIDGIKSNPEGRRHIVTAWNPSTIDEMALPACHSFFQIYCDEILPKEREEYQIDSDIKYWISLKLFQRSGDLFLGVPYNIASYALLTHILGTILRMKPLKFIHTFGDLHLYENHIDQATELFGRDPEMFKLPDVYVKHDLGAIVGPSYDFSHAKSLHFNVVNYMSYPHLAAPLSTGIQK